MPRQTRRGGSDATSFRSGGEAGVAGRRRGAAPRYADPSAAKAHIGAGGRGHRRAHPPHGGDRGSKGNLGFEDFYREQFGAVSWSTLRSAMSRESPKVALYNRFCQLPFQDVTRGLTRVYPEGVTQAFVRLPTATTTSTSSPSEEPSAAKAVSVETVAPLLVIPKPPQDDFQVRGYYLMDLASALVVEQLNVGPFDRVLDLCAAPGGKSIAIAQFLSPDGHLTANEQRADRCARLRRNLKDYIPINRVPWTTTQRNAETWHDPCAYTRVLVDAPCSSERHLLQQAGGGCVAAGTWDASSSQKLSRLQLSLLRRALETCAEGGRVVYSTCSISPYENDSVVEEAMRTTRCDVVLIHPSHPLAETEKDNEGEGADDDDNRNNSAGDSDPDEDLCPTRTHVVLSGAALKASRRFIRPPVGAPTSHGWMILPGARVSREGDEEKDTDKDGEAEQRHYWGPIYMAVLHKRRHNKMEASSSSDESASSDGNNDDSEDEE